VEKGTKQYNARLRKAKEKFLNKQAAKKIPEEVLEDEPKKIEIEVKVDEPKQIPVVVMPTEEEIAQAEQWKDKGNNFFKERKYDEAIQCYSEAIKLNKKNAVYYSNRAAALQYLQDYEQVIQDCSIAIELDPQYLKPYMRLGAAYESLGKFDEAADKAYNPLLLIDPGNEAAKQALDAITTKKGSQSGNVDIGNILNHPGLRNLASQIHQTQQERPTEMPQGEKPNLFDVMNNPLVMNMAQQAMQNGDLQRMLSNPAFSQMAQNFLSDPQALSNIFGAMGGMGGSEKPKNDDDN